MQGRQRFVPNDGRLPKVHPQKLSPPFLASAVVTRPIEVGHPKISIHVPVTRLPLELYVPEPSHQPDVTLRLRSSGGIELHVRIAGKTFRRCLKSVISDGPMREDRFAVVQGRLAPNGVIDEAGLAYAPKPGTKE